MLMNVAQSSRALFDALTLMQPYDINRRKVRWGSPADGGYVYAEGIRDPQPLLSLGVGWSCEIEYEFASRGHPVVMYDPTVDSAPRSHPNFTFHKIGLAGEDSADGGYLSLESVVALAGWQGRNDIILKMDVEGAELPALANATQQTLLSFEQISFELHWLHRLIEPEFRGIYMKAMRNLTENFRIFHVHANNYSKLDVIGGTFAPEFNFKLGGFTVVDVVELTLIRSDLAEAYPSKTFYPTALDQPNHPPRPDHLLAFYPFLPTSTEVGGAVASAAEINDLRVKDIPA